MASLIAFHCEEGLRRSSSHETRHFLLPSVPAAATAATTTTTATTATATTATTAIRRALRRPHVIPIE